MWDDDESDKSWRDPNAKKMTFDEMTARAQYEWQRAEDAEAEVRALHARADAPPTLAEAMRCEEVRALVTWAGAMVVFFRDDNSTHMQSLRAILAKLKGHTP
jgi:hypothetical protein